jgi:hypothetical protein
MFQFYKIVNGAGSPISEKRAFTGVYWNGSVPRGNSNVYSLFKISYPSMDKAASNRN